MSEHIGNKVPPESGEMRLFDTAFAVMVNVLLLAFLLLCIDTFFGALNSRKHAGGDGIKIEEHGVYRDDELMGYTFVANSTGTAKMTQNGETVFDITYDIDEYGRRITPVENPERRDKFAVFFGCSYTAGFGVSGGETFPCQFGKLSGDYVPYNYAVPANGPQNLWMLLKNRNLRGEIPAKLENGIGVYAYISDHITRAIGGMPGYKKWIWKFPYLYLDGDKLAHGGNFKEGRPIISWFYDMANDVEAFRYFNINFPVRTTESHLNLVEKIFTESAAMFKEQFPGSEFYILILTDGAADLELMRRLQKAGINVLDLSAISYYVESLGETYYLPDKHPTATAHRRIAEGIVSRLGHTNNQTFEK